MRVRPTTTWVTREAMEDFTYRNLEFKRGTTIHLFSESAGTDPRQLTPGFDIAAQRKPHFGFGGDAHHCLGHFRGAEAAVPAPQKSALRRRAELAAGQREHRPRQTADRLRSGGLNAANRQRRPGRQLVAHL